jgi:hypothetical protein
MPIQWALQCKSILNLNGNSALVMRVPVVYDNLSFRHVWVGPTLAYSPIYVEPVPVPVEDDVIEVVVFDCPGKGKAIAIHNATQDAKAAAVRTNFDADSPR